MAWSFIKQNSPYMQQAIAYTASQTKSAAIDMRELSLLAIQHPSTMGGKTITFEAALTEGGTYYPVYDDAGAAYSITLDTAAAHQAVLKPEETAVLGPYLKLVVSTAAAVTLTLIGGQLLERGRGF